MLCAIHKNSRTLFVFLFVFTSCSISFFFISIFISFLIINPTTNINIYRKKWKSHNNWRYIYSYKFTMSYLHIVGRSTGGQNKFTSSFKSTFWARSLCMKGKRRREKKKHRKINHCVHYFFSRIKESTSKNKQEYVLWCSK